MKEANDKAIKEAEAKKQVWMNLGHGMSGAKGCLFEMQEMIAAKLRAEAEARGQQTKQRTKQEMEAYEAEQRRFAEERAVQEKEVRRPVLDRGRGVLPD